MTRAAPSADGDSVGETKKNLEGTGPGDILTVALATLVAALYVD